MTPREKLLILFQTRCLTILDVHCELGITREWARQLVRQLDKDRVIYIHRWIRDHEYGPLTALYKKGWRVNAPKPDLSKQYRQRFFDKLRSDPARYQLYRAKQRYYAQLNYPRRDALVKAFFGRAT